MFAKFRIVEEVGDMSKKAIPSDTTELREGSVPPKAPVTQKKENPTTSSDSAGSNESSGSDKD